VTEEEALRKRIIREAVTAAIADFRVELQKILAPLEPRKKRKRRRVPQEPKHE